MQPSTPSSPNDVALARYYETGHPWLIAVAAPGPGREIITRTFFYGGDNFSLDSFSRTPWGEHAPAGARLFIAESGQGFHAVEQAWVGWRDAAGLHVISAYHEGPATIPVGAQDLPVMPPILVASRRMQAFVFQPRGAGASLVRHVVTGVVHTPVTVKSDAVLSLPAMPRMAAAAAVPLERKRDAAIVGWVTASERASGIGVAILDEATAASPVTFDIPGVRPVGGRLAVLMKPVKPQDAPRPRAVQVAFVAERVEQGGYVMILAELDLATSQFHLATTPLPLPPGAPLRSAFVYLPHTQFGGRVWVYALRNDGVLMGWRQGDAVVGMRKGYPLDYAFPIEDTEEPRITSDGNVDLVNLSQGWESGRPEAQKPGPIQ